MTRQPTNRKVARWVRLAAPALLCLPAGILFTPHLSFGHTQSTETKNPLEGKAASPPVSVDLRSVEAAIQRSVQLVLPSTVAVRAKNEDGSEDWGSGVLVSEDQEIRVLTAAHCLRNARDVEVYFPDLDEPARGRVSASHEALDVAWVEFTSPLPKGHRAVPFGNSKHLQRGQWCFTLGCTGPDHSVRLRAGRVLRGSGRLIYSECSLTKGDSGGPLFDLSGRLVGLDIGFIDGKSVGMHVPGDQIPSPTAPESKGGALWQLSSFLLPTPVEPLKWIAPPDSPRFRTAAESVVQIQCEGVSAALGTVVTTDGWILTKASEMRGPRSQWRCLVGTGVGARWLRADSTPTHRWPEHDLELVKFLPGDRKLTPVVWADEQGAPVGTCVLTPTPDGRWAVGTLSANATHIPDGFNATPRTLWRAKAFRDLGIRAGWDSIRADGFETAYEHDTWIGRQSCGGPLLNLDGKAVGINVGQSARPVAIAVPAAVAKEIVSHVETARHHAHER